MVIRNAHLAFFSPAMSTGRIAREVAGRLPVAVAEHDLLQSEDELIYDLDRSDVFVAAVPVYAGRVPQLAAESLGRFTGDGTPAIAVCVYGNRAYDDALIELCDLLRGHGFVPVAAGAFIARHSMFPAVAAGRPDEKDIEAIHSFGDKCAELLSSVGDVAQLESIAVRGERPYRSGSYAGITPAGSSKRCSRCGRCASLCPMEAIDPHRPYRSLSTLCISCGRCVAVCPVKTRCFSGVAYMAALRRMTRLCSSRKQPETFFAQKSRAYRRG